MTERDRVRDTGLKGSEGRAGEEGGGDFTWRGERGRGAKKCQQLSSPWTELSLRASAGKNTSPFLTYSSPLSVSQHQSAHLGWMQERQDDSHESAGYGLTCKPNFKCSLSLHKEKPSLLSFIKLYKKKKSLPATITHSALVFLEITSLDLFLYLPHLPPSPIYSGFVVRSTHPCLDNRSSSEIRHLPYQLWCLRESWSTAMTPSLLSGSVSHIHTNYIQFTKKCLQSVVKCLCG